MILVAGTAVGIAWMVRFFLNTEAGGESRPYIEEESSRTIFCIKLVGWWLMALSNVAGALAFTLLILRLRRPRPQWWRVMDQPGTAAAVAVVVAILIEESLKLEEGIRLFLASGMSRWNLLELEIYNYWCLDGPYQELAVVVAWTLLALGGRWRREPGWLDAFGLALGGFWLVNAVSGVVYWIL